MNKYIFGCLVTAIMVACAQLPAITADVVSEVQCVQAQIEKGNNVYEDVALACGGMAVADVVTIVQGLQTPDGGSPVASKMKHKASK